MASTYKVLGQAAPAATTATTLYTAPAATSAVVSTLAIANRGASTTFRVAIRPAGEALADQHYVVYDGQLGQYESAFLTLGISLAPTDVVTVYAGTATVSFSLFGAEITA
jgi:hypothetical protein